MNLRRSAAAARQLLNLIDLDLKPRDIVTSDAIDNAFALDMAMGGSTNTVLHTLALAHEAGVEYPLARLNEVAERVPNICKVSPSSNYHVEDVDGRAASRRSCGNCRSGRASCTPTRMTVTGKTLLENVQGAESLDKACIRPLENPYSERGGLAILFGNLAPDGAVIKTAGVLPEMLQHRGPAVVFDSHDEANAGILSGKVKAGDVVVIRYEGPKGGPGMQEMLAPTSNIMGMGLGSLGRAAHRRPVQRRHTWRVHRPCLARSRGRRPDRAAPGRRHGHAGHPRAAAGRGLIRR